MKKFILILFCAVIVVNSACAVLLVDIILEIKYAVDGTEQSYTDYANVWITEWRTGTVSPFNAFYTGNALAMIGVSLLVTVAYSLTAYYGIQTKRLAWKDVPPLNFSVPKKP